MGKPSSIVSAVLNQGIRHRPGVVIVIVALMKRQRTYAAASLLVGALAMVLSTSLVANAIPNKHGIPVFVADVLKIPYNFCFNVLDLEFWTNTNADTIMATPNMGCELCRPGFTSGTFASSVIAASTGGAR